VAVASVVIPEFTAFAITCLFRCSKMIVVEADHAHVMKNYFAFATAPLWHKLFEITLKLYLYGKSSIQTMIFWSFCAFIWFKNIEKKVSQMTSGFLQLESTIFTSLRCFLYRAQP
jgi:hypothetical protein